MLSKLDNFYLTSEELAASPSRVDGINSVTETQLRHYGCDLVQEAVIALRLPQAVAVTAQILLQRFYCKCSLKKFPVNSAAMAATSLACKLEEVIEIDSPTKLGLYDLISSFYRLIARREGSGAPVVDPRSAEYESMKSSVVKDERHMLRSFGFVLSVEQPHRFIVTFGRVLGLDKTVLQEAWALCNDSMRSPLCVRYKADVVAAAMLYLAARRLRIALPEQAGQEWWRLFINDHAILEDICQQMDLLYSKPKPIFIDVVSGNNGITKKQEVCVQVSMLNDESTWIPLPTFVV